MNRYQEAFDNLSSALNYVILYTPINPARTEAICILKDAYAALAEETKYDVFKLPY